MALSDEFDRDILSMLKKHSARGVPDGYMFWLLFGMWLEYMLDKGLSKDQILSEVSEAYDERHEEDETWH